MIEFIKGFGTYLVWLIEEIKYNWIESSIWILMVGSMIGAIIAFGMFLQDLNELTLEQKLQESIAVQEQCYCPCTTPAEAIGEMEPEVSGQ